MANSPSEANGYQHLMLIVAVCFVLKTNIGFIGPRCGADRPVLMNPTAIDGEGERRREQPLESQIDAVLRNVVALGRVQMTVEGKECLVGHRRIIERQGPGEQAVASNAVGFEGGCEGQ